MIVASAGLGWVRSPGSTGRGPGRGRRARSRPGAVVDAAAQTGDENVLVVATDSGALRRGHHPAQHRHRRPHPRRRRTDDRARGPRRSGGHPTALRALRRDGGHLHRRDRPRTGPHPACAAPRPSAAPAAPPAPCSRSPAWRSRGSSPSTWPGSATPSTRSRGCRCARRARSSTRRSARSSRPRARSTDARRATEFVRARPSRATRRRVAAASSASSGCSPRRSTGRCPEPGLLDLPRVAALRPALGHALTTDAAGLDQVLAVARSLRDLGAIGVTFSAVPTDPDPTDQGTELRDADANALFDAVRTDAPLPATAPGAVRRPTPSDVTVEVLNASDRDGLAAEVADTLRDLGFRTARSRTPASPRSTPSSASPRTAPSRPGCSPPPCPRPTRARSRLHRRAAARARPIVRRHVRAPPPLPAGRRHRPHRSPPRTCA